MNQIILQPAGSEQSIKHYNDTIHNLQNIDNHSDILPENVIKDLKKIYPNNHFPVWGSTTNTHSKWLRIERGDLCLFTRDKMIIASGIVTYKINNREFSDRLWTRHHDNKLPFENIFFLDKITDHQIPYLTEVNPLIMKPNGEPNSVNNINQGITVIEHERCFKVFEKFSEFNKPVNLPSPKKDTYGLNIDDLEELYSGKRRKDQQKLKKILFNTLTQTECAICNKTYLIKPAFLICAHIKKRSKATNIEKIDAKNIVAPMCTFGCDNLFERGFIVVIDGKVQKNISKAKNCTDDMEKYIEKIQGNVCSYYTDKSKKYFKWHQKYHNR